jgi:hypothetical protein
MYHNIALRPYARIRGAKAVETQMHKVDLHYTKEELLIIFDQAYK